MSEAFWFRAQLNHLIKFILLPWQISSSSGDDITNSHAKKAIWCCLSHFHDTRQPVIIMLLDQFHAVEAHLVVWLSCWQSWANSGYISVRLYQRLETNRVVKECRDRCSGASAGLCQCGNQSYESIPFVLKLNSSIVCGAYVRLWYDTTSKPDYFRKSKRSSFEAFEIIDRRSFENFITTGSFSLPRTAACSSLQIICSSIFILYMGQSSQARY